MSTVQLELSDAVLKGAKEAADEQSLPLDRFLTNAITDLIGARREMDYLRSRAERGRNVDVKAILRKAPDVEPEPHDRIG